MILLSVVGLCMWIPSFHSQSVVPTLATFLLSLCNAIGIIIVCYKRGISRMFSLFTGYIFILLSAALLPWHSCWQGQLVGLGLILAYLTLNQVNRHLNSSASEETFLATLLIGIVSYWLPSVLCSLLLVIILLILRKSFDGRSFLAIFIGLLLVAIYMGLFIYLGWIDRVWSQFFAPDTLNNWIPIGMIVFSIFMNIFFYSAEHISRGIVFFVYNALCLAGFVLFLIFL